MYWFEYDNEEENSEQTDERATIPFRHNRTSTSKEIDEAHYSPNLTATLSAGKYYIGDLSYVLRGMDWFKLSNAVYPTEISKGCFGIHQFNNKIVAIFSTVVKYGSIAGYDTLNDKSIRFAIDTGSIGIIKLSDVTYSKNLNYGLVADYSERFLVKKNDNGIIDFGHIKVNSGNEKALEELALLSKN